MLNNINDLLLVAGKQEGGYEPYHEVLEYVKLDGTQYFNPDLLTNADYTIEARFKLTDTSSSSSVFGGRNSSSNPMNGNQLHYIYTNGKTQYIGGYYPAELAVDNAITLNDVCEVVCDKTGFSIAKNGGTPTKYSRTFSAVQYTTDLMIGATYTKTGETIQFGFRGEYYTFKVRLNGELIRDYVPSLDSKMRPCLYDKVSKTFLYAKKISDGTTAYDLGFKRWNKFDVDYIESTGTQYINTGINPTNTLKVEMPAKATEQENSRFFFGSRNSTAANAATYACLLNTPQRIGYKVGAGSFAYTSGYNATEKHTYAIENGILYCDDTQIDDTYKNTTVSVTSPLALFTILSGSTYDAAQGFLGYCYGCKLWDNGTLVRDYKPVIWHNGDTTAEACLYDEVYNKMYQNAGTGSFKAYIENTLGVPYEVGMYLKTIKTGNSANVGPIVELGEYPQDGMGYHIKTTTDSTSSNYLFGSRLTTSGNLAIATLLGSSNGGTILSGVMGGSITWKSGTTTWARSGNGTTYECSLQTYKDGNTYKFDVIGYNYTLGKEADRQTQTYPNPIDEQQNAPMLLFGAVNTINILFGNNSHYFVEWNLPNVRHTLLPVINSTHTKICFIDNRTKQIYEFTKVGTYTPTTNNITFKQLDGTIITGTLT